MKISTQIMQYYAKTIDATRTYVLYKVSINSSKQNNSVKSSLHNLQLGTNLNLLYLNLKNKDNTTFNNIKR